MSYTLSLPIQGGIAPTVADDPSQKTAEAFETLLVRTRGVLQGYDAIRSAQNLQKAEDTSDYADKAPNTPDELKSIIAIIGLTAIKRYDDNVAQLEEFINGVTKIDPSF